MALAVVVHQSLYKQARMGFVPSNGWSGYVVERMRMRREREVRESAMTDTGNVTAGQRQTSYRHFLIGALVVIGVIALLLTRPW
jgi:hypothetical protein